MSRILDAGGSDEDENSGCQAVPKSERWAGPEGEARRMAEGLMSRWMMPWAWMDCRAWRASVKMERM